MGTRAGHKCPNSWAGLALGSQESWCGAIRLPTCPTCAAGMTDCSNDAEAGTVDRVCHVLCVATWNVAGLCYSGIVHSGWSHCHHEVDRGSQVLPWLDDVKRPAVGPLQQHGWCTYIWTPDLHSPGAHHPLLKQILGVRKTVPTVPVWREVPVKRLEDIWWQRTVNVWNSLAAAPPASLYRHIALASCRSAVVARNTHDWARFFYRGVRACE